MKIRKGTFQHVESELFAFPDTIREIERLKDEILYGVGQVDENVGGGRGSIPSDPTGQRATLMASHRKIEQLERISKVIRNVHDQMPDDRKRLIKLRYWTRPQTRTWDGIAIELSLSRRQAIRWRDEIVYLIAERIGWR